jgi:hypothetical protein
MADANHQHDVAWTSGPSSGPRPAPKLARRFTAAGLFVRIFKGLLSKKWVPYFALGGLRPVFDFG